MKELKEEAQIGAMLEASRQGPVFVLKHSTACPISAGAKRRVDEYLEGAGDGAPFYLLKVIESRPVSNALTRESGVHHASPQLILFHEGEAKWDTSHGAITGEAIRKALAGVSGG
jgi:bacillithiol system protein YtxJ